VAVGAGDPQAAQIGPKGAADRIGVFIPFFAGMIIGQFWVGLAVWIGLAVLFFGYVEALVLCRHCPHYAEEGFLLKCHANSGLPKIPRFDPRPLSRWEQAIWIGYVAVLFLYSVDRNERS
jgi:hypothetical protein